MKIAVLAVYFGNLPSFTQLFLASCNQNKGIDFLLIGDAWRTVEGDVPSNCYIQGIDLNEFKKKAEKQTGFKPNFSSPYKLCDYKPTLGEVFRGELEGYDYWGFCDIDIILGDMKFFLMNLDEYDVFSTHNDYLSGPLFFFRNTDEMNGLFRQSRDVEKILCSPEHFSFTECAKVWKKLQGAESILEIDTPTESMTEVIIKGVKASRIKAHFETLALEPEQWFQGVAEISGGQVRMKGKSYIHYHHLHNKGCPHYTYPNWHWTQVPPDYHIMRYGVFRDHRSWQLTYRFSQFYGHWEKRVKRIPSRIFRKHDANTTKLT